MPERNDLSNLNLNEFSVCFKDLGGPANEDCTIEFVKSKSGLGPVLKETDMSEHNIQKNDEAEGEADEDFAAFAEAEGDGILSEFSELSEDDQAAALIGMAYDNLAQEAAIEDATDVIKSLSENTVSKAKYDEVVQLAKSAGDLIEKMKTTGNAAADDGGLVAEIRKANGGADLAPEAVARIEAIEKAQAETDRKDSIAKAKTWGFGKAEDVADLHTRIKKSLGAKDADAFEALIKQAGQVAKASPLFKPIGEDAGNADATSPIAKCNAAVVEIRKANPKLTEVQAKAQYWAENPAAYAEYQAQRTSAA